MQNLQKVFTLRDVRRVEAGHAGDLVAEVLVCEVDPKRGGVGREEGCYC